MEEFDGKGDVVELLLDCGDGTLAVKKNGKRLGVVATGLTRKLCWAVGMWRRWSVSIEVTDPAEF